MLTICTSVTLSLLTPSPFSHVPHLIILENFEFVQIFEYEADSAVVDDTAETKIFFNLIEGFRIVMFLKK
jgi:hypothetical protein